MSNEQRLGRSNNQSVSNHMTVNMRAQTEETGLLAAMLRFGGLSHILECAYSLPRYNSYYFL